LKSGQQCFSRFSVQFQRFPASCSTCSATNRASYFRDNTIEHGFASIAAALDAIAGQPGTAVSPDGHSCGATCALGAAAHMDDRPAAGLVRAAVAAATRQLASRVYPVGTDVTGPNPRPRTAARSVSLSTPALCGGEQ
jgi:hypothetical protein